MGHFRAEKYSKTEVLNEVDLAYMIILCIYTLSIITAAKNSVIHMLIFILSLDDFKSNSRGR